MKTLTDNSVDSIVTDPPYGLSFMGKKWDYEVPSTEIWAEALRVLKPGGHLLAFFGTRTYHRGVIKIEDAGFEIRDQIQWIYGSGFPKSTDVSKRIDKEAGADREVIGSRPLTGNGKTMKGGNYHQAETEFDKIEKQSVLNITAPSTDQAKQWQGWGSSLKPANEPIVVARKPLEKGLTLAQNVLKYGTGGINIDASRIGTDEKLQASTTKKMKYGGSSYHESITLAKPSVQNPQGRWPANILFDESAAELLDAQQEAVSRFFYIAKASKSERNAGLEGMEKMIASTYEGNVDHEHGGRKIGANPNKATELSQNHHPTVKPIKLMQYLIRLVTPPNGTVLDPFMGSGSTGVAAKSLGFDFIGCEMSEEYFEIAKNRIGHEQKGS